MARWPTGRATARGSRTESAAIILDRQAHGLGVPLQRHAHPVGMSVLDRTYPGGTSGVSRLDYPPADGVADEARRVVDVQLGNGPAAVGLHGADADPQQGPGLLRGLAHGQELQDLG